MDLIISGKIDFKKNIRDIDIYTESFMFSNIFTISSALHFFLWIWVTMLYHFYSTWGISFSTFWRAGLQATKSVNLHLPIDDFILPSFWRIVFLDIEFLPDSIFSPQYFVCHSTALWFPYLWWKISTVLENRFALVSCVIRWLIAFFFWRSTKWHKLLWILNVFCHLFLKKSYDIKIIIVIPVYRWSSKAEKYNVTYTKSLY